MSDGSPAPDSRAYPARPIVGVGAVVIRGGAVLLIQRGREPLLNRWSLPGGAVELGETLREAVIREVREETGLRVEPRETLATLDRIVRDADGRVRYHYVLVDWMCDVDESATEPVPGDDAKAVRWVAAERLRDAEFELEDLTLEMIDRGLVVKRDRETQAGKR